MNNETIIAITLVNMTFIGIAYLIGPLLFKILSKFSQPHEQESKIEKFLDKYKVESILKYGIYVVSLFFFSKMFLQITNDTLMNESLTPGEQLQSINLIVVAIVMAFVFVSSAFIKPGRKKEICN